jgi:hypothetical protein
LDMNTTNVCETGSIHTLVPVNPVWPNDPSGNSSPRFEENDVLMSHPSPRVAPSSETTYGSIISGDGLGGEWRTQTPAVRWFSRSETRVRPVLTGAMPPLRIIWQ